MLNLNEFRVYISHHLPAVNLPDFPGSDRFLVTQYFDRYTELSGGALQREILFNVMYDEAVQFRLLNNMVLIDFGGPSQPTFNEADLDSMTPEQIRALDAQCGPNPYFIGLYTITDQQTTLAIENTATLRIDLGVTGILERVSRNTDGTFSPSTGTDASLVIPVVETTNRLVCSSLNGIKVEAFDDTEIGFSLPLCRIKGTEAVIQIDRARFRGNLQSPEVLLDEATLAFGKSVFDLGDGLAGALPKITAKSVKIAKEGISGTFSANWPLDYNRSTGVIQYNVASGPVPAVFLGGLKGGLETLEFSFENNKLIKGTAKGKLVIPYFETPVDILLEFNEKFEPKLVIDALNSEGLVIEKTNLLKLQLKQFTFDAQNKKIGLSGALEPLLFAAEGMKWPKLDVKDLFIDSQGKLSIKEAWMDMQGTAALDFYGFSGEIKKVGFGMEGDQMWFGFSGGMKLIDFLPIKGDVENCRFKWPETLDLGNPNTLINELKKIQMEFSGVNVDFEIPKTLSIKGSARLIKEPNKVGFGGDMVLDVPTAGFKAEAGLLVGMNFEMPAYAFFMTYFGFELAAGIPLGQSGLALKGALGMLGINVEPDRNPDQNWYADWYKRGPDPGAHQTYKWRDARNSFALGIGVTITSADGFVKGTRGLLVLAIPGPILILEGRALLLEGLPASNPKEPPLRALAIFDGKEQIAQFNIEAQVEVIADTLDASGELEAFFDFKDITNWHIFLGIDEPKSRRIKANLLNVVRADAYLMFDMKDNGGLRTRLGASTVVEPPIDPPKVNVLGQEIGIDIKARFSIDGRGEISMMPDQFSGELNIDGELSISALGLEASVMMEADMKASGPSPFSMEADFRAQLNLPDGLPDYEFEHKFKYTLPAVDRITLEPPLAEVSLVNRFKTDAPSAAIKRSSEVTAANEVFIARQSPTVEMDSFPVLAFSRDMNQASGMNPAHFLFHPAASQKYSIGEVDVTPEVTAIRIYSQPKNRRFSNVVGSTGWTMEFNSAGTPKQLIGAWVLENDPSVSGRPPYKKLQLHTPNPVTMSMHSMETVGGLFGAPLPKPEHLSKRLLDEHKGFLFGPLLPSPESPCVSFNTEKPLNFIGGSNWSYAGLHFYSPQRLEVKDACLRATESLSIAFDRPVKQVVITFCRPLADLSVDFCQIPAPDDKGGYPKGSFAGLANPDFQYLCFDSQTGLKAQNTEGTVYVLKSTAAVQQISLRQAFLDIDSICPVYDDEPTVSNPGYAAITLPAAPEAARMLKPGNYYKIEIQTKQTARVFSNRKLYSLYKRALGLTGSSESRTEDYTHVAYFQTEGPPANLAAYVKSSYPEAGNIGVLTNTRAVVRFKRNYLNILLSGGSAPEYALMTVLRSKDGNCWHLPFGFSQQLSTTMFPDEESWEAELKLRSKSLGLPRDMGVDIQMERAQLEAGKGYTLLLGGGSGGEQIAATGFGNKDVIEKNFNISTTIGITPGSAHTQLSVPNTAIVESRRKDLTDFDLSFDFIPNDFGASYFNVRMLENGNNRVELVLKWNPVASTATSTTATLNGSELRMIENGAIVVTSLTPFLASSPVFNLFRNGADQKNRIRIICLGGRLHVFVNYNRIWTLDLFSGYLFSAAQQTGSTGSKIFSILTNPTTGTAIIPIGWSLNALVDIFQNGQVAMQGRITSVASNSITVLVGKVLNASGGNAWMLGITPMLPSKVKGWTGGISIISTAGSGRSFTISNLSLRRAAAIEIPFTANRAGTLPRIAAAPLKMEVRDVQIPAATLITDAMNGFTSFRQLEQDLWDIERDAEFRLARREPGLTGTEAVDSVRLRTSQQLATSEQRFRSLVEALNPELLLAPVPEKTVVRALKDSTGNRLIGLWVHFPDYMDAAAPAIANSFTPAPPTTVARYGVATQIGRFRITSLVRLITTTQVSGIGFRPIWKPDSSRVLLLFNSPLAFTPDTLANFRFRLSADRILNHGDATANIPHRYDRPVLTATPSDVINLTVEF